MIKKLTLIVFISYSVSLSLKAQVSSHCINSELGLVYLGSGDLIGVTSGLSYAYSFNSSLAVSSRFMFVNAERFQENGEFQDSSIGTIDLLFQWTPHQEKSDWLTISIGPSLRKVRTIEGAGYVKIVDEGNTQTHGDPFSTPRYINESAIGFTMITNFRLFQIKNFQVGLQPYIQAFYSNGDITSGLAFTVGYRF